jgi:hypothetical protein
MEHKEIQGEVVDTYMKNLPSLERYDRAFKLFWAFCTLQNISATSATLTQVAGLLVQFNDVMPAQARHAYASLLLVPGMDQLQFNPLLRQVKKSWNHSQSKYATFYDASGPIAKLAAQPLNWEDITAIRTRLLLVLRFFMLCRNVDLERMFRTVSMVDDQPFILIQRKGQKKPQWEAVLTLPEHKHLCPWTLLQRYVALTSTFLLPGSSVFRSLHPPFTALKANTLGSLTKQALTKLGVNTCVWKPHATRGAGVTMYKKMGLTSEQVCEIGKWKNVAAFSSHYLRLGATNIASHNISQLVHRVSPLGVAESDLTWTPGKDDPGGSVREDEAMSNGEPTLPPFLFSNQWNSPPDSTGDLAQHMSSSSFPHQADSLLSLESSPSEDTLFLDQDGDIILPPLLVGPVLEVPPSTKEASSEPGLDSGAPMTPDLLPPRGFLSPAPELSPLSPGVKRPRSPGGSPPKKFVFATRKHPYT